MKFILKSAMALAVLTASLNVMAETSREYTASFLTAMQSSGGEMGTILHDIVRIQEKLCGHEVTIGELKTLSANDNHYFALLRDATLDDTYLHSDAYWQQMNHHFGACR